MADFQEEANKYRLSLIEEVSRYDWSQIAPLYDREFSLLADQKKGQ